MSPEEMQRLQTMTLIHAGYKEYIPEKIREESNREINVKVKGVSVRMTDEIKQRVLRQVTHLVLEGYNNINIYHDLIELGMLTNDKGLNIGYVTFSRYVTQVKKSMNIDVQPLYLKVKEFLSQGYDNEKMAKVLDLDVNKIKRARGKLKCVEKRERLRNAK